MFRRLVSLFQPSEGTIKGYDHPELIGTILLKTRNYTPLGKLWPDVAGAKTVLDFGGGCGRHYWDALLSAPDVRWAVVETPAMVEAAHELGTDRLRFFASITAAVDWLGAVDLVHSNGALQYTPDPLSTLEALTALRAKTMLWERLKLSRNGLKKKLQSSRLQDNGPGGTVTARKTVLYDLTMIPRQAFLDAHNGYRIIRKARDRYKFALL